MRNVFPGRELLTPREYQVLELIANGASNKEAGRRLRISPRTIEVHRARVMEKLGAKNTADLVRIVLAARLNGRQLRRRFFGIRRHTQTTWRWAPIRS
jgi:two-component system response regulator FixJ